MKNKTKIFGIYLPVYIAVLIAAVAMRTVALFIDYSMSTGYYDNKILISIADYFVIITSVFLFSYTFTAKRGTNLIPNFTSPATYIPSAAVTAALIFAIRSIANARSETQSLIKYLKLLGTSNALQQVSTQNITLILLTISFIFAILSAIHFALSSLIESHYSNLRAYFGLSTTVFFAVHAAYIYFNTAQPINAPNKLLDQITFLFIAAFFLFEARLSIGREKWRGYIAFGFISSLLAAYSSIPSMIYYFATLNSAANTIYDTALLFTVFIFITARLLLTGELIENKPSATVEALIASADAREKEVTRLSDIIEIEGENLEAPEEYTTDENQITIDDMGITQIEIESEAEAPTEETE